jgi:hypothetical protein
VSRIGQLIVYVIIPVLIVSISSIYLHHHQTPVLFNNWGFKYNDIVHGVFNARFSPNLRLHEIRDKWYNTRKYYDLTHFHRVQVYPYIDYKFEYPPVVGLIWIISVNTAIFGGNIWELDREQMVSS